MQKVDSNIENLVLGTSFFVDVTVFDEISPENRPLVAPPVPLLSLPKFWKKHRPFVFGFLTIWYR